MTKIITLRKLRAMLRDDGTKKEELIPYFIHDEENSSAFAPAIKVNFELVDDEGLEGDIALAILNSWSRRYRHRKYKKKSKDQSLIRIVSEGDSWFQYPLLLKDVIDQLFDDYAIYSLGAAGDTLEDMLDSSEYFEAVEQEKPHIFMISGGGNDLAGNRRIASMLHPFDADRPAEEYPNSAFSDFLDQIVALYRRTFTGLLNSFPSLKILCHGYDHVVPNKGKWLGSPMESIGIKKRSLQKEILHIMIDRLNDKMINLAAEFPGSVYHIDCRGVVTKDKDWEDELHPENVGFEAAAGRFKKVINTIAPPMSPGIERQIAASDLPADEYRYLVARRARSLLGADLPKSDDEDVRRKNESDIARYFEKIHRGGDFLPVSFLMNGAHRAKAVCRISTQDSLGSGFLIASNDFIMTNNHVLPDRETASASSAEFGFEAGSISQHVALLPERFFVTDQTLDYTIVACEGAQLTDVEPIPLLRNPATVVRQERVNIIQHPRGRPKEVALHDNRVIRLLDQVIRYHTDTEPGTSGSPVFNNEWDLVALHHAGWRESDSSSEAVNEGIRIASIVAHLVRQSRSESTREELLRSLLSLIPDSSSYLGFFDVEGVVGEDDLEVEVPQFKGSPDFADIGFMNIEHFNQSVSDDRVQKVAAVLDRLSMDVMGLTEVQKPALDRLVTALGRRGNAAAFELLDVRGGQDIAVLYDTETSEVTLMDDILDRYRNDFDVRTPGGKRAFPRDPLFARCQVSGGNSRTVEFILIVVHFKAFGDAQSRARRRLASEVLSRVIDAIREEEGVPVVLGGDFNEILNNDVLSSLTGSPDLFPLTLDDASTNAASYIGGRRRSLIDHIIVSRDIRPGTIAGDDAAIVRLDRSVQDFSSSISDHVPVVFRMVMRPAPIDLPDTDLGEFMSITVPEGSTSLKLDFD